MKIESGANGRRATLIATGEEVNIGSIEKMSKSKRNTVDPDDIIGEYGADVARWFMLSDSPPDRDVIWTEEGVQGSWRFVQRLWRLVREAAEIADGAGTGGGDEAAVLALRKAAHGGARQGHRGHPAAALQPLRRPHLRAVERPAGLARRRAAERRRSARPMRRPCAKPLKSWCYCSRR